MQTFNASKRIADHPPDMADDQALRLFVGYHMKRAYNKLRTALSEELQSLGLRISTYSSLLLIVRNPGVRQSELAIALDIERPNMVAILAELEQSGWVYRRQLKTDRRAYALFASTAGERVCKKAAALNQQNEARLLGKLSKNEIKKLVATLNSIESVSVEESK